MRRARSIGFGLVCAMSALFAPCAAQSVGEGETRIGIEYRTSSFVDQFFTVRRRAEVGEAGVEDGQSDAVDAARKLGEQLGSPLAWGPIEGLLRGCASAKDAALKFRELPETFELRGSGKSVRLRELAVPLADALAAGESAFREKTWPAHESAILAARARIDGEFVPKESACFERLARDLGVLDLELTVPVYLVAEGPFPGAVTQRDEHDRGVCFVAVEGAEGTQLHETILHEATHALDLAARTSVLEDLRGHLRTAGLGPRDRELHDVPHTLMFVEAAHVIRREIDPEHVDYGDAAGYYAKVPTATIVREAWTEHLAGRATLEGSLERIVAAVIARREKR